MAETLTIRIKPLGEAMATFRQTFKALEGSTRSKARVQRREEVFFTSIEARPQAPHAEPSVAPARDPDRASRFHVCARPPSWTGSQCRWRASQPSEGARRRSPSRCAPPEGCERNHSEEPTVLDHGLLDEPLKVSPARAPAGIALLPGAVSGSPHGAPSNVGKTPSSSSTVGSAPSCVGVGGVSSLA